MKKKNRLRKKQPENQKLKAGHSFSFKERVLEVVKKILRGKTLTYKEAARKAGNLGAYRAAGNILNKNFDPKIPCHRVIRSDGEIGGYNKGKKEKLRLLRSERALFNFQ